MAVPLYIRNEYFRGVMLADKIAHILEFKYKGETISVYEESTLIFCLHYHLESKFKAEILDFYLIDKNLRGKGYGTVCMNEILEQLNKKRVTMVKAPLGYAKLPDGYASREQYEALLSGFYEKTGFSIGGDLDTAIQILN